MYNVSSREGRVPILYCRDPTLPDEIFPCNCFSPPKPDEKVN